MLPMTTISGWGDFPALIEEIAGARALQDIIRRHDLPLSVLDAPGHRVPLAKMMRIFEAAARLTGDEEFGVRLGKNTGPADFGAWAAHAYCAPTLGEALKRVCSTLWAHESGTLMYLEEHPQHVVWCYKTNLAKQETVRHSTDHLFETVIAFFQGFLGPYWRPDWVEVDYRKPAIRQRLEETLGTKIHFNRPNFGVAVRKTDLAAQLSGPLPFARPVTSLDLSARPHNAPTAVIPDFVKIIDLRMMDGAVDLDGFAKTLDLGPRTLQRQLAKLGCTYKELLETEMSVKAIATDLGYVEPENFTRAFRKWHDVSPTEFRLKAGDARKGSKDDATIVAK